MSVTGDWVFACFAVMDLSLRSDAAALPFVEVSQNSYLIAPYRRFLCEPYFRHRGMILDALERLLGGKYGE